MDLLILFQLPAPAYDTAKTADFPGVGRGYRSQKKDLLSPLAGSIGEIFTFMNDTYHAARMHLPAEDCSHNPPCKKIMHGKGACSQTGDVDAGGGTILADRHGLCPG